jgi:hypothetical protein
VPGVVLTTDGCSQVGREEETSELMYCSSWIIASLSTRTLSGGGEKGCSVFDVPKEKKLNREKEDCQWPGVKATERG